MKKLLILMTVIVFAACNESKQKTVSDEPASMQHNHEDAQAKPDFSNVQFASKRDSICRMPLSAGVSDTAIVEGKTYGFCSRECKEAFLQIVAVKN